MGKLSQTFIVFVFLGFLSANPAFAVDSVIGFDLDKEYTRTYCWNCDASIGSINHDCSYAGYYESTYSSCTGNYWRKASKNRLEVQFTLQVSADGGPGGDGDVKQFFSYLVPYTLHRSVSIEQGKMNGKDVTYMVLPVVEWRARYLVGGKLEVDGNTGAVGEGAAVGRFVLEPGSRELISSDDYVVNTYGFEIISESYVKVSTWEAPELEKGDLISLDAYTCDTANIYLQQLCAAEGEKVWFQSSQEFVIGIDGSFEAWSNGKPDIGPIPIPIDGGEALVCFGRSSPMSSFGLECSTGAIKIHLESVITDSVRYIVKKQTVPNQWMVVDIMRYEDIPTLRHCGLAILALLMLGIGMVGFRRFA